MPVTKPTMNTAHIIILVFLSLFVIITTATPTPILDIAILHPRKGPELSLDFNLRVIVDVGVWLQKQSTTVDCVFFWDPDSRFADPITLNIIFVITRILPNGGAEFISSPKSQPYQTDPLYPNRTSETISIDLPTTTPDDSISKYLALDLIFYLPVDGALKQYEIGSLLGQLGVRLSSPEPTTPSITNPNDSTWPSYYTRTDIYYRNTIIDLDSSRFAGGGERAKLMWNRIKPWECNWGLLTPTVNPLLPGFLPIPPRDTRGSDRHFFRWSVNVPWSVALGGKNSNSSSPPTASGGVRPDGLRIKTSGGLWFVNNSTSEFGPKQPELVLPETLCSVNSIPVQAVLKMVSHDFTSNDLLIDDRVTSGEQGRYDENNIETFTSHETYLDLHLIPSFWDTLLGPVITDEMLSDMSQYYEHTSATTTTQSSSTSSASSSSSTSVLRPHSLRVANFTITCGPALPLYIANIAIQPTRQLYDNNHNDQFNTHFVDIDNNSHQDFSAPGPLFKDSYLRGLTVETFTYPNKEADGIIFELSSHLSKPPHKQQTTKIPTTATIDTTTTSTPTSSYTSTLPTPILTNNVWFAPFLPPIVTTSCGEDYAFITPSSTHITPVPSTSLRYSLLDKDLAINSHDIKSTTRVGDQEQEDGDDDDINNNRTQSDPTRTPAPSQFALITSPNGITLITPPNDKKNMRIRVLVSTVIDYELFTQSSQVLREPVESMSISITPGHTSIFAPLSPDPIDVHFELVSIHENGQEIDFQITDAFVVKTEWASQDRWATSKFSFPSPHFFISRRDRPLPFSLKHAVMKISFAILLDGPNPLTSPNFISASEVNIKFWPHKIDGYSYCQNGPYTIPIPIPIERWALDAHNSLGFNHGDDSSKDMIPDYQNGQRLVDLRYEPIQWDLRPLSTTTPSFVLTYHGAGSKYPTRIISEVHVNLNGRYMFWAQGVGGMEDDDDGKKKSNHNIDNLNNHLWFDDDDGDIVVAEENNVNYQNTHNAPLMNIQCRDAEGKKTTCTIMDQVISNRTLSFRLVIPLETQQMNLPTRIEFEVVGFANGNGGSVGFIQKKFDIFPIAAIATTTTTTSTTTTTQLQSSPPPPPPPPLINLVTTIITTHYTTKQQRADDLALSFEYGINPESIFSSLGEPFKPIEPPPRRKWIAYLTISILLILLIPILWWGYEQYGSLHKAKLAENQEMLLGEFQTQMEERENELRVENDRQLREKERQFQNEKETMKETILTMNKAIDAQAPPQYLDLPDPHDLPEYDVDLEGSGGGGGAAVSEVGGEGSINGDNLLFSNNIPNYDDLVQKY